MKNARKDGNSKNINFVKKMKIIKENFTLRELNFDDCESLAKYANSINVWNNVRDYFPHPYTINDAKNFINTVKSRANIQDFAITVNDEVVGVIGFIPCTDVERLSAEVGYWIGENFWNKGIMTEALKCLVAYIFNNTEFIRLFAPIFEFNKASMRVLEKAGFTQIAILNKAAIKNEKIINLHYFELLK